MAEREGIHLPHPGLPPPPPPPPTPSEDAVPFNAFDGLGLIVWTIVAQLVVGIGFAIVLLASGNSDALDEGGTFQQGPGVLVLAAASQIFTIAGVFAWLNHRRRLTRHLFGTGSHGLRPVLVGVAAGVGAYVTVTLLVYLGSLVVDTGDPEQAALEASTEGALGFVLGIVVAGILAPFLEEVVFRGVLFQALRHRMGVAWGVALSSLAFAIVHIELIGQPVFLGGLFALAAFLALLLQWTRSLFVPIVAHATFNVITLVLATFASDPRI